MRIAIWTGALALGVVVFAACAGGGDSGRGADSKGADPLVASCKAIGEIQSYRYTITLKLKSPAFQSATGSTPSEPLSAFAEALTALFADMRLDGAYVAPDRSQAVLRFQNEELELRAIRDQSWVRVGTVWQEQGSSPEPGTLLTPRAVCEELVQELAQPLGEADSQPQTVNGIKTDRYRLDEADLKGLPELLGTSAGSALPNRFAVDVWLAREGRWPVRLQITAADTNEQGQPASLDLFMEFQDINDPTIRIEPPTLSPAGP